MSYTQLWILVEGNDDERLIQHVKPEFEVLYDHVGIWKYAKATKKTVAEFLRVMNSAPSVDCIYLADINNSPCITAKREGIKNKYGNRIEIERIVIAVQEIESWYLAGLDEQDSKELGIKPLNGTDDITKEKFSDMTPARFDSRIDYMPEILKRFSVETGVAKNASFGYFMRKAGCDV
ncbi:MAG: hypothetical protein DRP66_04680 [Planctomycetota bacterium]|nr:MAG: hypothetical protein DRP66_04680 [Planctomycetota bacterium]